MSTTTMPSTSRPALVRRIAQIAGLIALQVVILFGAAGRLDWGAGWAYFALYVAFIGLNAALMLRHGDQGLIEERSRVGPGTKRWDLFVGLLGSLAGPLILLVAGLDERFGWSPPLGLGVQIAGGALVAVSDGLFAWAMASNPFFSTVVRIQAERGHRVISSGPYAYVRHPAYAGMLVFGPAAALLLDSLWACLPALGLIALLVARTLLEDRTLQRELPGYAEYAQKTRYRLVPGIW
jgi:protein-S-isoprenylcysteine O-methyltransferase Ste14